MMTKYQLVFAKIEGQVNRVLNSNKLRSLRFMEKAFLRFKENAHSKQKFAQYRANLVYLRLRENLGAKLLTRYQHNLQRAQRLRFETWKTQMLAHKALARLKRESDLAAKTQRKQHEDLTKALKVKEAQSAKVMA
jgi:hypothetical protein